MEARHSIRERAGGHTVKRVVFNKWDQADPKTRLLANTKKTSTCWLWMLGKFNSGYGHIKIDGINMGTHVASYRLFKGPIRKGLCVLHTCDVKHCIRPSHLWLGTRAENNIDMKKKNRHAHGEQHSISKLTEQDVRDIRKLGLNSHPEEIAIMYNVSVSCIASVISRINWRHVK